MSNNLSLGPVQTFSLDLASVNLALRELSERIDELKGLRGRSLIWDRTQVSSPTIDTDAVDLQSLLEQESRFRLDWISHPGIPVLAPGTSYVEISNLLRQNIDFSDLSSPQARVIVSGWGTGTGSGKGVALHDGTNTLAEVTWDGVTETVRIGDFTDISLTSDTACQLRVKGADANESLILHWVVVEFKVTIRVVT